MFRCQKCGTVVPAGVRCNKIVVASRPKTYPSRGSDRTQRRFRGQKAKPGSYDKGGTGHEIAQELNVCEACAEAHVPAPPPVAAPPVEVEAESAE